MGDQHGPLFLRIIAELGSERVVNKRYQGVELDCGPGLKIDDYFFYEEPTDGSLMALQDVGGKKIVFRVEDGRLVARAMFPSGQPTVN